MVIHQFIYGYLAKEESYEEGDFIIQEGNRGDWVYVVLEGRVKVKKTTPKGMVTIDTLKEGEIFGEMILWQAGTGLRTASVIAEGPVKVGVLQTEQLLKDYESISPRLKILLRSLIMRLATTTRKAATMAVEMM